MTPFTGEERTNVLCDRACGDEEYVWLHVTGEKDVKNSSISPWDRSSHPVFWVRLASGRDIATC